MKGSEDNLSISVLTLEMSANALENCWTLPARTNRIKIKRRHPEHTLKSPQTQKIVVWGPIVAIYCISKQQLHTQATEMSEDQLSDEIGFNESPRVEQTIGERTAHSSAAATRPCCLRVRSPAFWSVRWLRQKPTQETPSGLGS